MCLDPEKAASSAVHLRIPGWCVKGSLKVNGKAVKAAPKNGYVRVARKWSAGDEIVLTLAMPVQTVYAHPSVRQASGRLALQRGPLACCLAGADHEHAELSRSVIDPAALASFKPEHRPELLGGVTVLRGPGRVDTSAGWDGVLYGRKAPASRAIKLTAIPYYAWDNRAPGEMRVWLRSR